MVFTIFFPAAISSHIAPIFPFPFSIYHVLMQTRPAKPADLDRLFDIDGTIESSEYLHLDHSGEGFSSAWKLELRSLRAKLMNRNAIDDEQRFALKQIVSGADEGIVLLAEHDDAIVALAVAQSDISHGAMRLVDLRVDYDFRRQGIGSVLMYQIIQQAREQSLRAVRVETLANNLPANQMLIKLAFELTGLDTHRNSNHDMVKEAATMFWYAALD
jgi:ribosomal protein S18 acetylase RimI-like enzyme